MARVSDDRLRLRLAVRQVVVEAVARVVLVVDDEPLVREVTASMLEDLGCEVVNAASGNDALEKLSGDRRIEILITDINMPGMGGYELGRKDRTLLVNDARASKRHCSSVGGDFSIWVSD